MDNETSEWIDRDNKPEFESDYSFFSAITFLTIGAVTVVLFSVYLMVCILRIKVNNGNNHIKQILYLTIIDTTVGIALICRAIFAVVCPAKQTFETCAAWSYIFVALQSISYFHILAICIHRCRVMRKISVPVPTQQQSTHGFKSLVIWIAVIIIALPPYVLWMRPGELLTSCRIDFLFNSSHKGPVIYLLVMFCTPWLITNIIYIGITTQMCCHRNNNTSNSSNNTERPGHHAEDVHQTMSTGNTVQTKTTRSTGIRNIALNREKSIIRIIGFLLVVFNTSILSYIFILFRTIMSNDFIVPAFVFIMGLSNNILNPFLYTLSVPTLRNEMKQTFVALWIYCRSKLCCINRVPATHNEQ